VRHEDRPPPQFDDLEVCPLGPPYVDERRHAPRAQQIVAKPALDRRPLIADVYQLCLNRPKRCVNYFAHCFQLSLRPHRKRSRRPIKIGNASNKPGQPADAGSPLTAVVFDKVFQLARRKSSMSMDIRPVLTSGGPVWPRAMGCRPRPAGAIKRKGPNVRHIAGATPGSDGRPRRRRCRRPSTSAHLGSAGSQNR